MNRLPLESWLSPQFLPAWFKNKLVVAYRLLLTLIGYKFKSTVHGIPTLDYTEYRKMVREIVRGKRSYIFNDENWGLGEESLEEFIINLAEWDKDYGKNK